MDSDDKPLMQQIFEKLERDGKLVKTGRMRNGKPVYVHVEHATEEELEAARRRKY